ncbi:16S rRNA (uracil(1498)-N(3))-methyltransferase [Pontibacillus yanchengensis]|uniref:16S rRNA (Uracil(1498)-N(3))-methyltransferase n=2 Tax=Pontibacillus yanchengensis TaxID=462910 RepID=A0ACC7VH80_9BACI|nr:16S rRNA (uracil(1498)-N(3))-methyltransferase [Pontibacillus yanchengensis]MYL33420.1 16S rRNA (uracil(1498)-N(3))-methyltransferase [Pontibacillus yanchengensis]MYL53470.1 16S rRNA (uracil(1498)-N(3))-methyltransferase [Pontibacillus yanchengensis]
MQRYFVSSSGWENQHVTLTGEDVHHITKVMRMRTDDEIICCTPEGQAALCKIIEITHDMVTCYIVKWLDEDKELPAQVTIVQGLPKGDKMELVIQKGTELGASRFIPFEAERSIVKWDAKKTQKKVDRYQKIAKEASEQSHRTMIPTVSKLYTIKQLIEEGQDYDWKLLAYEDEAKSSSFSSLKDVIPYINPSEQVMIVIGPEGGFSENEVDLLKGASFMSVRLGPRILRAETAPAYFLSAISYQLEELR